MIGDIYVAKELSQTYQPLLLCEFTFPNGEVLRLSTHPLSNTYGGAPTAGSYEYGGNEWQPRITNQDIGATQAMSDLGIDIPPQVLVVIADPSKSVYQNWELAQGFKGATLKLYAVMFDAGNTATGSFSSNSPAPIKFIGICGAAAIDQDSLTVTATSLLNFTQKQMPPQRIQQICAWSFPPDDASQLDAITNPFSIYKQCGYSYGQVGGFGNPDPASPGGTGAFTYCPFDVGSCIERLGNSARTPAIEWDKAGNQTGRFGGYQWVPAAYSGRQKPYTSGVWTDIVNAGTEAKYGDFMPLCYGTTWANPLVMGIWGDGNYTDLEVAICYGQINRIHTVLVNGIQIMQYIPDTDPGYRPSGCTIPGDVTTHTFVNGYWKTVNDGRGTGQPNPNPGWGRQGDPYGSVACIYISVLVAVASQNSVPTVSILLDGVNVAVYSDPDTYTSQFSRSPVWVLLDILLLAGWPIEYINIASLIAADAVCSTIVNFDSLTGSYQNYYNESGSPSFERFSVGFTVGTRMPFGDLIRGLRAAMRAMIYFDFNTGQLTIVVKQTLADQQPAPITGSNYNTPIGSVTASGMDANGYVAYSFDESSIVKDAKGRSSLGITQRTNQDSPNKTTLQFLDRENTYNADSVTVVDVEDVNRIGCEVVGSMPVIGCQTFDHARRILNCWLAEGYRGNSRLDYMGSAIGDTGGTLIFSFTTSVKALHLGVGDLCLISDQQSGIVEQLFRVTKIKPSANFESAQIIGYFHNDNWYQDTFGQSEQPIYARAQLLAQRAPFSWRPGYLQPMPGDAYYAPTDLGFAVMPEYSFAADGSVIANLQITGVLPINSFSKKLGMPKLELVGVGNTGGGYPSGTSYFAAIAEKEDGTTSSLLGPVSAPVMLSLSSMQDALDFVVQAWNPNPSGWVAFAGNDPYAMSYQFDSTGSPEAAIFNNDYNVASWTPPDQAFANFTWEVRKIEHGGIAGATLSAIASRTGPFSASLSVYSPFGFGSFDFTGYEISAYGLSTTARFGIQEPVPIANFSVLGNNDYDFVVAQDPTKCVLPDGEPDYGMGDELPLEIADIVVLRMKPTFGQDSTGYYFEDLNWINPLNYLETGYALTGLSVSPGPDETFTILVPSGTLFPFEVGDFVVITNVTAGIGHLPPTTQAWEVGGVDTSAGTFTLVGYSSDSTLVLGSNPMAYRQIQGLEPGAEVGRMVFCIAGTGKGMTATIASNTSTRCYIAGTWPMTPDSTTRLIICDPTPVAVYEGNPLQNASRVAGIAGVLDVHNYAGQSLLVHARSSSANGLVSSFVLDKFREVYVLGAGGATPPGRKLGFPIGNPNGSTPLAVNNTSDTNTIPFALTITGWSISLGPGQTGALTVEFWMVGPGSATPTVANLISISGVSLSSGASIESTMLTDFTTLIIPVGAKIVANITAVSGGPVSVTIGLFAQ